MDFHELGIPGAWVFTPTLHTDDRGVFLESFTRTSLEQATGRSLEIAQTNISQSRAGTIRGIHFASVPPGQAKYVQCLSGSVYDVVVDVRAGSPTFGEWAHITLNSDSRQCLFISEGLGHAFAALEEDTTVLYHCSTPYQPDREFSINPHDTDLNIQWPCSNPQLSGKDRTAPTLSQALSRGLLPTLAECVQWARALRT